MIKDHKRSEICLLVLLVVILWIHLEMDMGMPSRRNVLYAMV